MFLKEVREALLADPYYSSFQKCTNQGKGFEEVFLPAIGS